MLSRVAQCLAANHHHGRKPLAAVKLNELVAGRSSSSSSSSLTITTSSTSAITSLSHMVGGGGIAVAPPSLSFGAKHYYSTCHWKTFPNTTTRQHIIDPTTTRTTSNHQQYSLQSSLLIRAQSTNIVGEEEEEDEDEGDHTSSTTTSSQPLLFSELPNIHPSSLRAVEADFGLTRTTDIQSATFEAAACRDSDVLGRARTGTGKTLAFLLPALETLIRRHGATTDSNKNNKNSAGLVVIISPTRELATQIGDQAGVLLKRHRGTTPCLAGGVQTMFGGTPKHKDVRSFERQRPAVLVTTPGRFLDHLRSTHLPRNNSSLADVIRRHTQVLVLDETDRLLDMGFRDDVRDIIGYLPPKEERQTLLFSATMPQDLRTLMADTLRSDYLTADCVSSSEQDEEHNIHQQVRHVHAVLPSMERYVPTVLQTILRAVDENPGHHKIMAFFPTAMLVKYFAYLFQQELNFPVLELHAKKSQDSRTNTSKRFRRATKGVLLTTDVSARGVDYPDVTHVIQFGMADSRETYIHRLGRTGRAGKQGQGWLVLAPFETPFLDQLQDLNVEPDDDLLSSDDNQEGLERLLTPSTAKSSFDRSQHAAKAYQTMLSFYTSRLGSLNDNKQRNEKVSKADLVQHLNDFCRLAGLSEPPSFSRNMVQRMGFVGVPGLRVSGGGGGGGNQDYQGYREHSRGRNSNDYNNDRGFGNNKGNDYNNRRSGWMNRSNNNNNDHKRGWGSRQDNHDWEERKLTSNDSRSRRGWGTNNNDDPNRDQEEETHHDSGKNDDSSSVGNDDGDKWWKP